MIVPDAEIGKCSGAHDLSIKGIVMRRMRNLFICLLPVLFGLPAVSQAETYFGYSSMGTTAVSGSTTYTATGTRLYGGMAWPLGKVFVTGAEVASMDLGSYNVGSGFTLGATSTAVNWVIGPRFGNFGIDLGMGYVSWGTTLTGSASESGTTTSTFVNLKYRVYKKLSIRYETASFTAKLSSGDVNFGMSGIGVSLDF